VTGASTPPIRCYLRVPVEVHKADPDAPEVARRLIALIATRWPATPAEHIGSSAVPGLAGKNIIDLLMAAQPAQIPAITQALLELGFQPQVPAVFPATRPMLWGAFRHGLTTYRVHVHVVPAGSPGVAAMRGFRDALRADPRLRRRYAALKQAIVRCGPVDPVTFTKARTTGSSPPSPGLAWPATIRAASTRMASAWTGPTGWPYDHPPSLLVAGSVAKRDRGRANPPTAKGQVISSDRRSVNCSRS
jgi:GrpB-like predicted nucleotidyltransferase (UPF0157 family)